MTERGEAYLITATDLQGLVQQLNQIFGLLENRLDQLQGLRGTPKFYSNSMEFHGSAAPAGFMRITSGHTAEFGSLETSDISDAESMALQSSDDVDITGGDIAHLRVSILDPTDESTIIHQFPLALLAQSSGWMGFH